MSEKNFIIVGLGNPGRKYEGTRHNIGFIVLDEIARAAGISVYGEKWQALWGRGSFCGSRVCLVKPDTYMNLSGQAVVNFVNFYKVHPHQVLVIHDDIDMPPGRLKLVGRGGPGGHNGIRSLIQHLGTEEFYRLKIGVGRPGSGDVHPDIPVDKYVLGKFTSSEFEILQPRIGAAVEGICEFIGNDPARAMNFINTFK